MDIQAKRNTAHFLECRIDTSKIERDHNTCCFPQYFEELSKILMASRPPDLEKIAELDKKYEINYNMEWVPSLKEKYGLKLVGE